MDNTYRVSFIGSKMNEWKLKGCNEKELMNHTKQLGIISLFYWEIKEWNNESEHLGG